ncbi:hypothetical protein JFL43_02050 [Viridibacillus sp. YIM B01967]|uniref:DUF5590 domain-containing protein n=1 Tax=Viridibacillus soli TaxID=2798301 RepID=A0ABS1H2X3_9BACL|nr:hypothetical protein [Viridibacillus soli]MBK3493664.1 hypothetical protein [Viridibacillus soli]
MSKKIILLSGSLLIFVLIGYYFLVAHFDITRHAERMIEAKIPKGAVLVSKNDRHKLFKNNGEFYVEYHLKPKQVKKFKESIAEHESWKTLPANEDLRQLVAKQIKHTLPVDELTGNYFFKNDKNDDTIAEIMKSDTYEYTIAIFNEHLGTLYILKKGN